MLRMARNTRQRSAVRAAVDAAGRPLSPVEVLDAARRSVPGLGVATVYRTIRVLLDEGALVAVELPGAPARYEPAGRTHHHHFRCRACDRVYEVPGCASGIAALTPAGFELDHHDLVLYGRCDACLAAPDAPAARAGAGAPVARQRKSAGAPVAASPSATSAARIASSRREPARRSSGTSSDAAM
jgi:Fur family ferric uptake transcriptional regulator